MNPGARRALDLQGELEAVDARGHRIRIACAGERVVLQFDGLGAAWAAARCRHALQAQGLRHLLRALALHAPVDPAQLALELRIGPRAIGRAGRGAVPNRLGRLFGAPWLELRAGALLAALVAPRG